MTQAEEFLASYIETALWSSTDENGRPLDGLGLDLSDETIAAMRKDCEEFQKKAEVLIEAYRNSAGDGTSGNYHERPEQIAHDFWLTRNHHGAGFWDGDYPEPLGQKLTDLAHSYRELNLYIGDDGKLYLE